MPGDDTRAVAWQAVATAHELVVWVGRRADSLMEKPVEEQAAGAGVASVEPESEFVEVVVELLRPNPALMGGQQPALEQSSHPVDPWHQLRAVCGGGPDGHPPVPVPSPVDPHVALPGVGQQQGSGLDVGFDEAVERESTDVADPAQPEAPRTTCAVTP